MFSHTWKNAIIAIQYKKCNYNIAKAIAILALNGKWQQKWNNETPNYTNNIQFTVSDILKITSLISCKKHK